MSTDNRTTLNDCSATTGWTGDDSATVVTLTGQFYEGSQSLSTQLSDADEHMYTTSIGGTRNLSDATVYLLVKDNLVDTKTGGGVKYVLHDGTDRIGYEVGGSDAAGIFLDKFFNGYKLDVTNRSALTPFVFAGVEANLTVTAITGVGFGSLHLSKAQGAIDNVFMDRFSFIANDSAALTVNGGTAMTPETASDVAGDDITNGWGIVSNPQGAQFNWFAPTEFGDAGTGTSYFEGTDEQWYLLGQDIGATHFDFDLIANSTGTNSFVLTRVVIVGLGARSNWNLAPANHDVMQLTAVTWTDIGTITMPVQSASNRFANNCIFNNCDQVDFQSIDADGCVFNGSNNADGAIIWDETVADVANQDNFRFNSDGTGNAIEIAPTGAGPFTYNISGYTFDGYAGQSGTAGDRLFFINPSTLSADITVNLTDVTTLNVQGGGAALSHREVAMYTGTATIQSTVNIEVTGVTEGTTVTIIRTSDDAVLLQDAAFTQDGQGGYEVSTGFAYTADTEVRISARNAGIANAVVIDATTDETADARSSFGGGDVTLSTTSSGTNDFGHDTQFAGLKVDITTALSGSTTVTWQYWDGDSWESLTGVTDNSNGFQNTGEQKVTWTIPGDWATTTINSQGPYYYVRALYSASAPSTAPVARKVGLNTTRYRPFEQINTITSSGLSVKAVWVQDTISQF